MKYEKVELDSKATKVYKIFVGTVGLVVGISTLTMGIIMSLVLSLPMVGGILIFGVLPADIILTTFAVKNAKVELVTEEFVANTYEFDGKLYREGVMALGEEVVERIPLHMVSVDNELKTNMIQENVIQFDSIKPIERSLDNEDKDVDRVRVKVIKFNPNKK